MINEIDEVKKMEQCDICKKSIERDMKQYVEFAKAFLADERVAKAAQALLPFDGDVPGCLHFYGDDIIKGMGATLMRMDIEPQIYSLGIILELTESDFGEAQTCVAYISACKTYQEYKEWVESEEFEEQASQAFCKLIDEYFFSQGKQ